MDKYQEEKYNQDGKSKNTNNARPKEKEFLFGSYSISMPVSKHARSKHAGCKNPPIV
ncbi:hypothetical protein ACO0LF_08830 [Undibacterium sp. Di27W]|uniref:hypothetical protein n=1 Tax=Undibacterium sp. Di27W TaxID=3413036 RepID=UPI003BEFC1BD